MRKFAFILILVCGAMIQSCAPIRWYLVNSEGIFTYNKHTGQVELMWNTTTAPTDTTIVKNR